MCWVDAALEEPGHWLQHLKARLPNLPLFGDGQSGSNADRHSYKRTCYEVNKLLVANATSWYMPLSISRDLGHTFDRTNAATAWHRLGRCARHEQARPCAPFTVF